MIHVTGLSVTSEGVSLLRGVDFRIRRGQVIGLMGPLASGKTTLLKALAGLISAHADELHVEDEVRPMAFLGTAAWQSRVGFAFQSNALFDRMTLFDNVAFPLRRRQVPEPQVLERTEGRLRDVGLWEHRNKWPNQLSGGMQKRAGIARATVTEPSIGLFDDPLAGLDPPAAAKVMGLIVGLVHTTGMGALVVSNDLPILLPNCHRVLMLDGGEILYDGRPSSMHAVGNHKVARFIDAAQVPVPSEVEQPGDQ